MCLFVCACEYIYIYIYDFALNAITHNQTKPIVCYQSIYWILCGMANLLKTYFQLITFPKKMFVNSKKMNNSKEIFLFG